MHNYVCIPLLFFKEKQYINCLHNRIFPKIWGGPNLLLAPRVKSGGHNPMPPPVADPMPPIILDYFWCVDYYKIDRITKTKRKFEIFNKQVLSIWTLGWVLTENILPWAITC